MGMERFSRLCIHRRMICTPLSFIFTRYAIWKIILAVNLVLRTSFCLICIAIMTTKPVGITVQGGVGDVKVPDPAQEPLFQS